jgi:hypothetical protein
MRFNANSVFPNLTLYLVEGDLKEILDPAKELLYSAKSEITIIVFTVS